MDFTPSNKIKEKIQPLKNPTLSVGFLYHKDLINVTAQLLLKYAWSNLIYIEKYENLYNVIVRLHQCH